MSVVGTLSVKITGDNADLSKSLADSGKRAAAWAAAAAVAAAAAAAAFIKSGANSADALGKLTDALGGTVEGMQGLQRAAERSGVSSEQLQSAMSRLNRTLGEASTEGGIAADNLARFGLNAADLMKLDVDERMAAIADQAKRLGLNSSETAAMLGDLGIRQASVVNLMLEGGDAIRESRLEIEAYGIALSRVEVKEIEKANDAFGEFGIIMEGVSQQLAAKFAPIMSAVFEGIIEGFKESGGAAGFVDTAVEKTIRIVAVLADSFDVVGRTFNVVANGIIILIADMQRYWSLFLQGAGEGIQSLMEMANYLPLVNLDTSGIEAFAEKARSEAELMRSIMAQAAAEIEKDFTEPLAGEKILGFVDAAYAAAEERAAEFQENMSEIRGEGGGSSIAPTMTEDDIEKLEEDLERLREHYATLEEIEYESFERRKEIMDEALANKLLTDEEYKQLAIQNAMELNNAIAGIEAKRAQNTLDGWKGALGDLSSLMSSGSKKLFNIGKAAALAEAIVSGWGAATAAWEKGMKIGGPPVAAAFTAASIAKTGAQIASLRSTQIGGGGTTSGGAGGGTVSIPSQQSAQPTTETGTTSGQVVQIALTGEVFGREQVRNLISQINESIADGAVLRLA